MVIRIPKNAENSFTKNVSFMFVVYWGVLVLWQNISIAQTRGSLDLAIKIGLLVYFTGFYLLRAKAFNLKALFVVLLAMSLLITASTESQFSLSNLITYVYPILVLLLVYGLGDGLQINRSQLVAFCNCIICIVAYTVFYAVLFCPDQYQEALGAKHAYGNELSSFFISNHEYGMYLAASIISAIICLRLRPDMGKLCKVLYITAMAMFSFNLVLTFSRTSMLGLGVFLLTYCFFETPKARKWIIAVLVLVGLALFVFPSLAEFAYKIVLKENNSADRDVLFAYGVQYFQNGSVFEKIFGHGFLVIKEHFDSAYGHSSVHNGYLQILLSVGWIGCGAMILFLLIQIVTCFRFRKVDRFAGTLSLALVSCAAAMMLTNTSVLFMSNIDAFFLTIFFVLVPKYVRNGIQKEAF